MATNVTIPDGFRVVSQTPSIPDGFKVVSQKQPKEKDYTLGRLAAFDNGATFGFGRKIGGALNAIGSYPVDRIAEALGIENTPSFKDRYNEIVNPLTEAKEQYEQDKPAEALALEFGGSVVNPINKLGVGYIGKGATKLSKGLRSIGVGAGTGGLASAGDTENVEDLGKNVAKGTGIGSTVGGAIPLVSATLRGLGKASSYVLGKTTGAGDVAISDAFRAGQTGNSGFLTKIREAIDAEKLEKNVQENYNKIKQNRNIAYENDITRLKQATADKKLDINPVINDVRSIIKTEGGGADYLVDDDTAKVLSKIKDTLNKFYKDKSRHNLEGFDNLKKKFQEIAGREKEGSNATRVATNVANSVKGQILKQSPEYKAINDVYSKQSELLDDLKKVFSLNRNANSETVLKKIQSTARNNANTDWGYRAELLKKLDPTGEIQEAISANALNSWTPRGLFGSGAFYGGIFNMNPLLSAASSPRITGYSAYGLGKASNLLPEMEKLSPYAAQLLNR